MSQEMEPHYVDYSTLSTFMSCKEKGRLAYVKHIASLRRESPLVFGTAFHAGVAAIEIGEDYRAAFLTTIRESGGELALSNDDDKRSIEKGLQLLEGYKIKWKDSPYEILRGPNNMAMVEMGFRLHLGDYKDRPVILCGLIDGILRNKLDGHIYGKETKTTTIALSQHLKQAKPNHQVTIYDYAIMEILGEKPFGMVWDAIYITNRKEGIRIHEDFQRTVTFRSNTDHQMMLAHITEAAFEFVARKEIRPDQVWQRNTAVCHNYGGCAFRDICISNANPDIIKNNYSVYEWKPWEGRTQVELRI